MRVSQIVRFKVGHVLVTIWSPLFFEVEKIMDRIRAIVEA